MRIAIVGVGGVGGYYGGLLARHYSGTGKAEIVFIARGEHKKEIQANGLHLETDQGDFTVRPDMVTDDPAGCGKPDLALFCVKSYDLDGIARSLSPLIGKDTVAITLLNGVDNAERLSLLLQEGVVLNGCVYLGTHIVRPGFVRQAGGSCKMFFGTGSNGKADTMGASVEEVFRCAGIDARYRKDIQSIVWEKFILICPFAGATTFLGMTIRDVLDDREGKILLDGLMDEVVSIAKAKNVLLPEDVVESTLQKAAAFPREMKTSMMLDFERGRRAELDTFTGYIVSQGRMLGVGVPHHERVYTALRSRLPV